MGNVNTAYIPPAILYLNPGLTREEFAQELNKIRVGDPTDHHREWNDFGDPKKEKPYFHGGIFELGDILQLHQRERWFYECAQEEEVPALVVVRYKKRNIWQEPRYRVEGRRTRSYPSLANLVKEHPQYNPDKVFDWSKSSGSFHSIFVGECEWEWKKREDRYFLSEYPPIKSRAQPEGIYSSIVITAEAIKAQAWNLFGWEGYNHTRRFLVDHPDAQTAHAKALQN